MPTLPTTLAHTTLSWFLLLCFGHQHCTSMAPAAYPHLHMPITMPCTTRRHWVFLHALEAIFLLCFVVFDATAAEDPGAAGSPERRLAFSALAGVLLLSSQVRATHSHHAHHFKYRTSCLDAVMCVCHCAAHPTAIHRRQLASNAHKPAVVPHILETIPQHICTRVYRTTSHCCTTLRRSHP